MQNLVITYSEVNDNTINSVGDSVDEVDDFEDSEDTSDVKFDREHCISNEISNFEQTERNHNEAFVGYKQLPYLSIQKPRRLFPINNF